MARLAGLSVVVLSFYLTAFPAVAQNDPSSIGGRSSWQIEQDQIHALAHKVRLLEQKLAELKPQASLIISKPWVAGQYIFSFFTSLLGLGVGFAITRYFALRSEARSDSQRQLDLAMSLSKDWLDMNDLVSEVNALLNRPQSLIDSSGNINSTAYGKIIWYGNWLENLAERYNNGGIVDVDYIRNIGLIDCIKRFKERIEAAEENLRPRKIAKNLRNNLNQWTAINELNGITPKPLSPGGLDMEDRTVEAHNYIEKIISQLEGMNKRLNTLDREQADIAVRKLQNIYDVISRAFVDPDTLTTMPEQDSLSRGSGHSSGVTQATCPYCKNILTIAIT